METGDMELDLNECTSGQPTHTIRVVETDSDIIFALDMPDTGNPQTPFEDNIIVDDCLKNMEELLAERHDIAKIKYELTRCEGSEIPAWSDLTIRFRPSVLTENAKKFVTKETKNIEISLRSSMKDTWIVILTTYMEEITGKVTATLLEAREKLGYNSNESGVLRLELNRKAEILKKKWQKEFALVMSKNNMTQVVSETPKNIENIQKELKELKELMEGFKSHRGGRGGRRGGRGYRGIYRQRRY